MAPWRATASISTLERFPRALRVPPLENSSPTIKAKSEFGASELVPEPRNAADKTVIYFASGARSPRSRRFSRIRGVQQRTRSHSLVELLLRASRSNNPPDDDVPSPSRGERLIRFTETSDKISLKFHRGICSRARAIFEEGDRPWRAFASVSLADA